MRWATTREAVMDTPNHPVRPGRLSGRLWIVAAALMWSSAGVLAKSPAIEQWCDESIRGVLLAFWRSLLAALVLLPLIRRPRWTIQLVPMVIAYAAMNVTYLSAIAMTTAANAIWLQATAPIWVFLAATYWLGEVPRARDWLPLTCGMTGVGTILFFEFQGNDLAGVSCGLLSGLFFAFVILSLRRLRGEDAVWLVALNHSVTAVILLPFVVYQGIWPGPAQLPYLFGLGIFQMGVPYVFFARGLRAVRSHEASGIVLIEPVLMPLWTYMAWREMPASWTVVGGSMIFAGLLLRYLGARDRGPGRNRLVKSETRNTKS